MHGFRLVEDSFENKELSPRTEAQPHRQERKGWRDAVQTKLSPFIAFGKGKKNKVGAGLLRTVTLPPERSVQSLQEEVDEERALGDLRQQPKWMINPESKFKRRWDTLMTALVIYVSYSTPLTIGFFSDEQCTPLSIKPMQADLSADCQAGVGREEHKYSILLNCPPDLYWAFNLLVDILFWLDIAIAFRTGFRPPRSLDNEYCYKKIARRYTKGWFLIDFVAVFPFDALTNTMSGGKSSVGVEMLKLVRLLRLSQLARKMERFLAVKMLRMLHLVLLYTTIAHWIACGFFFGARWQVENLGVGAQNQYTGDPWMIEQCLQFANFKTQYTMSLYWAFTTMTTVGYGDIVPSTNMDRAFTMVVMLVGGIVQAIIFGNVAVLIQNFDLAKKRLRERLGAVTEIISFYDLPEDMAYRITDSIEYSWNLSQGLDSEAFLNQLPARMRTDLLVSNLEHVFGTLPVFGEFGEPLIRALAPYMQRRIFVPEDVVVECGDTGMEMFTIQDGICQVLSGDGQVELAVLGAGDHFGDIDLILGSRRLATVKTITYCTMFVLRRDDLEKVLSDFPEVIEPLMETTQERRQDLQHLNLERMTSVGMDQYPNTGVKPKNNNTWTSGGWSTDNSLSFKEVLNSMYDDHAFNPEAPKLQPRMSFSNLRRKDSGKPLHIQTQEEGDFNRSVMNKGAHFRQLQQQVEEVHLRQCDLQQALEGLEKIVKSKMSKTTTD
ncbi:hypothetical protein BSKO_13816 [Bryopsis sp. KO-2023]|nr:hypothetical protein BSKO_13816 [Bryopsis sp. KO-2023]